MSDLRYSRAWYLFGLILTLAVIVSSLVPARDLPHLRVSDKLEHLIAYCSLALWFGGLLPRRSYLPLGLVLLTLGGGIEIVQGLMGFGREADWRDFFADALGIAFGLSLCMAGLRHWASWLEQWPKRR